MQDQVINCVIGDDHAVLRNGLTQYLRAAHGIRVVGTAADGHATLELVRRRRPQVAVVDAAMPGLSGLDVCREVLAEQPAAGVLIYTGTDDVDLLEEALEAGARGFVIKSGPPESLAHAIRAVAEGRTHVDAVLAGALLERRGRPTLLSARESQVLTLLADGRSTDETARQLFLSPATVRTYAENAMHKVDARNRVHLVAKSIRMGLLN